MAVFPEKDNRKALRNIIAKTGFNWVQVTDQFNEINTHGIYPATIILDRLKSKLVFQKIGALNEQDFKDIQGLLIVVCRSLICCLGTTR